MKRDDAIVAMGIVAVLYFSFSPALKIPFAFHNDLGAFTYAHGQGLLDWPEGKQLIPIGRLLNALLANFQFSLVNAVEDLTFFRTVSVCLVCLVTLAFWAFLVGRGLDSLVSAALSTSVFLLPSVQLSVVWGTQLVPSVLPLPLVALSYVLAPESSGDGSLAIQGLLPSRPALFRAAAAVLLLTVVNFIYPPTTAAFLIPTLAGVLFSSDRWSGTRRVVVRDLSLYLSSCLLFWVLQKAVVGPWSAALIPQGMTHGDPSFKLEIGSHLFENLRTVLGTGGAIAAHLWDITFSGWSSAAVAAAVVAGGVAAVIRLRSDSGSARHPVACSIQYLLAVGMLLVAANTPNLVSPKPLIAFRTLFAPSAMMALLAFRGLLAVLSLARQHHRLFFQRLGLVAAAVLVAASAQTTTSMAAFNSYCELEALRFIYDRDYVEKQFAVIAATRGVTESTIYSGRPILDIQPKNNLLRACLPMEFGLWLKPDEAYQLLAREILNVGVNAPLPMNRFLDEVGSSSEVWTRPNPWRQVERFPER